MLYERAARYFIRFPHEEGSAIKGMGRPASQQLVPYSGSQWRFSTTWYGTVRFTFGGFPLGTVPGTFLVPPRPRFQAIRTVTKT